MIHKYDEDVILRWKPVADIRNRKESRLNNNGTFSHHNHQLAVAELAEEVRVREQNKNLQHTTTTTTTTTVLCCAGTHCGMNNSPLDVSKDFHKCNTCGHRLHGILCCVANTFDEHAVLENAFNVACLVSLLNVNTIHIYTYKYLVICFSFLLLFLFLLVVSCCCSLYFVVSYSEKSTMRKGYRTVHFR